MAFTPDRYTQLHVARLWDFFNRHAPWHKALWSTGTILRLREVLEYAELTASKAFPTDEGLRYVTSAALDVVNVDAGLSDAVRAEIISRLDVTNLKKEAERAALTHAVDVACDGYLKRWATAHGNPADPPRLELSARLIAAHMIDTGLSMDGLLRWLKGLAKDDSVVMELPDLLVEADGRCADGVRTYEVLAPLLRMPEYEGPTPNGWLSGEQAASWIGDQTTEAPEGFRQNGALLITVEARDAWSAVEAARDVLVRISTRITLSHRPRLIESAGRAWVAGEAQTFPLTLTRLRNQVRLRSLAESVEIYGTNESGLAQEIDDALELGASLEAGTRGAALTGGWATIEGLLKSKDDTTALPAAARFASIVTCSFPTAQFVPLSYQHAKLAQDEVTNRLAGAQTNRDRARAVEAGLRNGVQLRASETSDEAMIERVTELVTDPFNILARVRGYVDDSLRRLYTQRNLIMHAGRFDSVGLSVTLRTSTHLVGAGLDRIVSAARDSRGVSPLQLAARAETELALLERDPTRSLSEMLP